MPTDVSYSRIPGDAAERWKLVRDVCRGRRAMVNGGYLPELNKADKSAENKARNEAYKQRAVLYNATGRTRDGLLGLAFRRDPQDQLPTALKPLLKDADGAGVSLYQEAQAALASVLETGRHGLFVDYSDTLRRPIIKCYFAEDIINWRTANVGGQVVLTMVVLREDAEEEDGFGVKTKVQWRELALEGGLLVCRIWQRLDATSPPVVRQTLEPRSAGSRLDFIPFQFIGAQSNDTSVDEAPLYDLAEINVAHYRNSADYEDSVFFVGQAQPWISGLTTEWRDHLEKKKSLFIGSRAPMLLPVNGAMGFAQVEPNSLAKEAMDHKEQQMVALGARLLAAETQTKTATQSDNDKETSTSVLSVCVANTAEAFTQALRWCGRYLDKVLTDEEATFKINQDFTRMNADPALITALVSAWQSGTFAMVDLRAFFRRLGVIPVERTDDDIDNDLGGEGPRAGQLDDAAGQGGAGGGLNGDPAAAA